MTCTCQEWLIYSDGDCRCGHPYSDHINDGPCTHGGSVSTNPIEIRVKECEQCKAEYVEHPDTHANGTNSISTVILAGFCSKYCERAWFEGERRSEELMDLARDEWVQLSGEGA